MPHTYDITIIGGGIVGLATALALTEKQKSRSLLLIEAEGSLAAHQTGHNSGVIHSGLYYKPGSSKARNCAEGREAMYRFCSEYGIAHDNCGKIVVATKQEELPALENLLKRGKENGLTGIRRLEGEELKEYEPHVVGVAGLHVPQTGIVDYVQVAEKFGELAAAAGGEIRKDRRLCGVQNRDGEIVLETRQEEIRTKHLINCAGLQSDRVARMCGEHPEIKIVPFRGDYYELVESKTDLVRNLIYPVPDPRYPFLGVHFTRMIGGGVEAGPNAVLALAREGYGKYSVSARDTLETLGFGGFWRLIFQHWKMGMGEMARSLSKRAFVGSLRGLIPELQMGDVVAAGSGIRAQALQPNGAMVDDFCIEQSERMIHVLNAPSPAATASISIGKTIAEMAEQRFAP
ncbi:MAG: L-2-hydroxyglutarate oxidase [Pirellulales bacterium]|nr:L-2-hydroxyglutarate oxidase [Pirellulales bacterium]